MSDDAVTTSKRSELRQFCLLLILAHAGCEARDDAFYEKVFACDASAAESTCGTTRDGRAMLCFPGARLGSFDFCTEPCDVAAAAANSGAVCTAPGGLLRTCRADPNGAACPRGMECFPERLGAPNGLCLPECTGAEGCEGPPVACGADLDPCRASRGGNEMRCFAAWQLRGQDFCAEACDPESSLVREGFVCSSGRALLRSCRPSQEDCPLGLECYRTDLVSDQGVCIAVDVCTEDAECDQFDRCASSFVRDLAGDLVLSDHLSCIQPTCQTESTNCRPEESCLAARFATQNIADVCVPKCDMDLNCPPNFSCLRKTAGPGSPAACAPGLPGLRCSDSQDCVVGDCLDVGVEFGICTIECATDFDCQALDAGTEAFECAENPRGEKRCVSVTPFQGANCDDSGQCPAGQACSFYSAYQVHADHGECRVPCDANAPCPSRGGLPHVCLSGGLGGCYPGRFGLPCSSSAECVGDLSCLDVPPDAVNDDGSGARICTIECATDADCEGKRWVKGQGFCGGGICRLHGSAGAPCRRDADCRWGSCRLGRDAASGSCGSELHR